MRALIEAYQYTTFAEIENVVIEISEKKEEEKILAELYQNRINEGEWG